MCVEYKDDMKYTKMFKIVTAWTHLMYCRDGNPRNAILNTDRMYLFSPLLGGMIPPFYEHIFQMGWFNHQLVDSLEI